jgi:hypothetical protein
LLTALALEHADGLAASRVEHGVEKGWLSAALIARRDGMRVEAGKYFVFESVTHECASDES